MADSNLILYHGGKSALLNLDGRGKRNRFLYTSTSLNLAQQYGEVITALEAAPDAVFIDFSQPEDLESCLVALEVIAEYASENQLDSDELREAASNGRLWELSQYVQDDLHDLIGVRLGADIISLPDSTFDSDPSIRGKTFVVLNSAKVALQQAPTESPGTQEAPHG